MIAEIYDEGIFGLHVVVHVLKKKICRTVEPPPDDNWILLDDFLKCHYLLGAENRKQGHELQDNCACQLVWLHGQVPLCTTTNRFQSKKFLKISFSE